MIRVDRVEKAISAIPEPHGAAVEQVLRVLLHDLNGAVSAVTMESFAIEQLLTGLSDGEGGKPAPSGRPKQLDTLRDAARNLRQAAEGAAAYLEHVEDLISKARNHSI